MFAVEKDQKQGSNEDEEEDGSFDYVSDHYGISLTLNAVSPMNGSHGILLGLTAVRDFNYVYTFELLITGIRSITPYDIASTAGKKDVDNWVASGLCSAV